MSSPYPPSPRKLTRSRTNKFIGGVCGGLAEYLNMDVNLVRIVTVLITLFTGVPVILYLLALFLLPEGSRLDPPPVNGPQPQRGPYAAHDAGSFTAAHPAEPAYPPYPSPAPGPDPVWGASGAPWEQPAAAADPKVTSESTTPEPKKNDQL